MNIVGLTDMISLHDNLNFRSCFLTVVMPSKLQYYTGFYPVKLPSWNSDNKVPG